MKKTGSLLVLLAASFILGGASSCQTPEPEGLEGTWEVKCELKDPNLVWPNTWWVFEKQKLTDPNPAPPTDPNEMLAKFKEIVQNEFGGIESIESFYMYQKGVLFLKDPNNTNQDRVFTLISTGKDSYTAIGADSQCALARSSQVFP